MILGHPQGVAGNIAPGHGDLAFYPVQVQLRGEPHVKASF